MLARRIIPCLDVDRGRVVKGIKFVDLIDAGDPVEQARRYDREGADELVFLDITASSESRELVRDMARRVADSIFIPFTVGAGIRTVEDMRAMLTAGADKISVNTAAIKDPSIISAGAREFGSQAVVVAIDARRREGAETRGQGDAETRGQGDAETRGQGDTETRGHGDAAMHGSVTASPRRRVAASPAWEVYTHGGRRPAGLDAVEWARRAESLGAGEILLTSMDCDGTRDGYDIELTRAVAEAVSIPVIASGGAGTLEHLNQALSDGKASAVLAASIFHFGEFSIGQAKQYLLHQGLPMRPGPV